MRMAELRTAARSPAPPWRMAFAFAVEVEIVGGDRAENGVESLGGVKSGDLNGVLMGFDRDLIRFNGI